MEKKGYSRKGFFGETIHYDVKGNKVGESRPNFLGGYDHFDVNGNKVGNSYKNALGGMNHYNADGKKSGTSYRGFSGQTNHYDEQGKKVGESAHNSWGGQNHYGADDIKYRSEMRSSVKTGESRPAENKPVANAQSDPPTFRHTSSARHTSNAFDGLLVAAAFAGWLLFVLGALLSWEDTVWYLIICVAALVWWIVRNK